VYFLRLGIAISKLETSEKSQFKNYSDANNSRIIRVTAFWVTRVAIC
jgi:hypothetical protein